MAARFLLTFHSFILILGLWTALLQKQDIDSVYNNLSRHRRCKWQGFYDLRSIFGHLYYMNLRAAMERIYANSKTQKLPFRLLKLRNMELLLWFFLQESFGQNLQFTWMSRQILDRELIKSMLHCGNLVRFNHNLNLAPLL